MRLADFIKRDMEAILSEWEKFAAAQLPAAADMDSLALRDHAEPLLRAIVKDIGSPQTDEEREHKSKGRAARPMEARNTEAETHALLRAQSGFTMNQLAAEYRALRASVLHLWTKACKPSAIDPRDVYRFNEAIDQAVAESVAFFTAQIENERNLFLGMLGHDMRSPLQVIQLTATYLSTLDVGTDVATCAARLSKSTRSLKALLDDLLDFNRTKLGLGITISPGAVDLALAFSGELEQLRVANPGRRIALEVGGDVSGVWDINRLNQLLGNLVVNALKYGASGSPVKIALNGLAGEVTFSVHNQGPKIEQSVLARIFEPLKRGLDHTLVAGSDGSMGLGLYIAREIAIAHHGDISAKSDENETVLTVRLPRLRGDPPAILKDFVRDVSTIEREVKASKDEPILCEKCKSQEGHFRNAIMADDSITSDDIEMYGLRFDGKGGYVCRKRKCNTTVAVRVGLGEWKVHTARGWVQ